MSSATAKPAKGGSNFQTISALVAAILFALGTGYIVYAHLLSDDSKAAATSGAKGCCAGNKAKAAAAAPKAKSTVNADGELMDMTMLTRAALLSMPNRNKQTLSPAEEKALLKLEGPYYGSAFPQVASFSAVPAGGPLDAQQLVAEDSRLWRFDDFDHEQQLLLGAGAQQQFREVNPLPQGILSSGNASLAAADLLTGVPSSSGELGPREDTFYGGVMPMDLVLKGVPAGGPLDNVQAVTEDTILTRPLEVTYFH